MQDVYMRIRPPKHTPGLGRDAGRIYTYLATQGADNRWQLEPHDPERQPDAPPDRLLRTNLSPTDLTRQPWTYRSFHAWVSDVLTHSTKPQGRSSS